MIGTNDLLLVLSDEYMRCKFTLCVHPDGYVRIRDATFEYNETAKDWQVARTSVQVSHAPGSYLQLLNKMGFFGRFGSSFSAPSQNV